LDFCMITVSMVELIVAAFWKMEARSLNPLSLLRMARLFRLVRVLRSLRNLRRLTTLIRTLCATLTACFWALTLLSIIIYVFSVAFTLAAAKYLHGDTECIGPQCILIFTHFGTLTRSFATLFQSICGGVDWGQAADALHSMGSNGWVYYSAFLVYMTFTYFAVLNVITALFCQQVVEHALTVDVFENKMESLQKVERDLLRLFNELDELARSHDSPPGTVTYLDLEDFLKDEEVHRRFFRMGIDPENAWMLFMLLDQDKSGSVTIEEFVAGCMRLRGECQRIDLHVMLQEVMMRVDGLDSVMTKMTQQLDAVALENKFDSAKGTCGASCN